MSTARSAPERARTGSARSRSGDADGRCSRARKRRAGRVPPPRSPTPTTAQIRDGRQPGTGKRRPTAAPPPARPDHRELQRRLVRRLTRPAEVAVWVGYPTTTPMRPSSAANRSPAAHSRRRSGATSCCGPRRSASSVRPSARGTTAPDGGGARARPAVAGERRPTRRDETGPGKGDDAGSDGKGKKPDTKAKKTPAPPTRRTRRHRHRLRPTPGRPRSPTAATAPAASAPAPGWPPRRDAPAARGEAGGQRARDVRLPASQKRHGSSTACVIPIRAPTTISRLDRPRRGRIRIGPSCEARAVQVEPDAERLGELARARCRGPRAVEPAAGAHRVETSIGSSARISAAAPTPSGSQTAFSRAWMP